MGTNTSTPPANDDSPSRIRRAVPWIVLAAVSGVVVAGIIAAPSSPTTVIVDPFPRTPLRPTPDRRDEAAIPTAPPAPESTPSDTTASTPQETAESTGEPQEPAASATQVPTPLAASEPSQVLPLPQEQPSPAPAPIPVPPAVLPPIRVQLPGIQLPGILVPGASITATVDLPR